MTKMNEVERGLFRFLFWAARRQNLTSQSLGQMLRRSFRRTVDGPVDIHEITEAVFAGNQLLAAGEFEGAKEKFAALTKQAPWQPDAYAGLAHAQLALGNLNESLMASSLGSLVGEGRPDLIYLSAEAMRRLGHAEKAIEGYKMIVETDDLEPAYHDIRDASRRMIAYLAAGTQESESRHASASAGGPSPSA